MRIIKFRAWDGHNKVMKHYTLKQLAGEDKFGYDTEFEAIQSGFDNWIWMQFVEKNYWYEGDIISGEYGNQGQPAEHTLLGVIKYRTGEFYIDFLIKNVRIYSVDGNDSHLWREDANFASDKRFYYYQITGMKKVGNIYENPELIK